MPANPARCPFAYAITGEVDISNALQKRLRVDLTILRVDEPLTADVISQASNHMANAYQHRKGTEVTVFYRLTGQPLYEPAVARTIIHPDGRTEGELIGQTLQQYPYGDW